MGDFAKWSGPSTTLASRGVLCNTPLLFSGENFLSGNDNGANITIQGRVWALITEHVNV